MDLLNQRPNSVFPRPTAISSRRVFQVLISKNPSSLTVILANGILDSRKHAVDLLLISQNHYLFTISFLAAFNFHWAHHEPIGLSINSVTEKKKKKFLMENCHDLSSSLSFASSPTLSNGWSSQSLPSSTCNEPGASLEYLSLSKLSSSLEKLLVDAEYDYSDAVIVAEGVSVGVNRCILAARSPFFHEKFKEGNDASTKEGKPQYLMSDLVPLGQIGYEAFMVVLNYLYTGKLKPSPPEVSTCVDGSCVHDSCRPAIDYAVQLLYASAKFQLKELVTLVQRRLLNFVDKAFVEDVVPILEVAFHCQLKELLSHCVHRVARSDFGNISLEKELSAEFFHEITLLRADSTGHDMMEVDTQNEKRIRRIHRALDSDDVELLKLLLEESPITLDDAFALHYAAAYCNPKIVKEVLSLDKANVNLRDSRGYTVLHVGARRKKPLVIVGLLNKGASVLDATPDGQTALSICRRLTRPKDYNETAMEGQDVNEDRLCIDVFEREMRRNPLPRDMSMSSSMVANDLLMMLLLFENRVAMARTLFPIEARLAMEVAHVDLTSEFTSLSDCKGSSGNFKHFDLNEMPSEQVKGLQERLQALIRTVETGRRFFPNCSEVLDKLLEDDILDSLLLDTGTPEEQRIKKMRYKELKDDVMKAFVKDKAENKWIGLPSCSSSSSSPKVSINSKTKRR